MEIAERIKRQRKAIGMNQIELAERIGLSINTIRRWEWGQRSPRAEEIDKLASALHTTVGYLMGLEDEPTPKEDGAAPGQGETPALPESNAQMADDDVVWVPVISNDIKVCCGDGNDYEGITWDEIGRYPILKTDIMGYTWRLGDGGLHIIAVEGDSMEPKVNDGDRILIADIEVQTGDLALCVYRGKTLLRGVSFEKKGVRLTPWNKDYAEIFVPDDNIEDLYFAGKMLGIVPPFQRLSSMW